MARMATTCLQIYLLINSNVTLRVTVTLPVSMIQNMRQIFCWSLFIHSQIQCQEKIASLNFTSLSLEIEIKVEDPLPTNNYSLKTTSTVEPIRTETNQNFILAAVEAEIDNEGEEEEISDREGRENVLLTSTSSTVINSIRNETTQSNFTEVNILSTIKIFASPFSTNSQISPIELSTIKPSNKTIESTTNFTDGQKHAVNETFITSLSNSTEKTSFSDSNSTATTESTFETFEPKTNDSLSLQDNTSENSTFEGVVKTMNDNGYNNWSLLQLLFFVILLIALGKNLSN